MQLQLLHGFDSRERSALSPIQCIGVSHHMAPADLREALSFSSGEIGAALESARSDAGIERIVIVSTCHRTELYADVSPGTGPVTMPAHARDMETRLADWLAANRSVDRALLDSACFSFHGEAALAH